MKKICFFLFMISVTLLWTACGNNAKQETKVSKPLYGTVLSDEAFTSAQKKITDGETKTLNFYMANSYDIMINDSEKIAEIWEMLGKVTAGNVVEEPGIDDGLIVFDFIFEDGSDYMISFLTSEYVYGDDSVYEVNDPKTVRKIIDEAVEE